MTLAIDFDFDVPFSETRIIPEPDDSPSYETLTEFMAHDFQD